MRAAGRGAAPDVPALASERNAVAQGFDADTVRQVERLLYGSEWKRYQAAPGPRISTKAFWLDRRYPLVNRWRDQL